MGRGDTELILAINVGEWQRAQQAMVLLGDGNMYRGMFRDNITLILQELRNYAESITHVETGTLASSHDYDYDTYRTRGELFINRRYVKHGSSWFQYAWEYGPIEHARGGSHAFYERTWRERGREACLDGLNGMVRRLDASLP